MFCKDCVHYISRKLKHKGGAIIRSDRDDRQVDSCLLDAFGELGRVKDCNRFEAKASIAKGSANVVDDVL
jgi:hypothetical protein